MKIDQTISHYKILQEIGQGGMGIVYKAQDTRLQRTIALKVLRPRVVGDPDLKNRFLREARTASLLSHSNISTIYDIDTWQGRDFIVMEYVAGETLKKIILNAELGMMNVIGYAIQIAEALNEAHQHHIIHRDIKSENLIITPEGRVKVMDFGLAKIAGTVTKTKIPTTMGTIAYMSPEQTRGDPLDFRTDIWSFGVVLYEMICGELPFKGDYEQAIIYSILSEEPKQISEFRSDVPKALAEIVDTALAKNREERFDSAEELLNELRAVADDSAVKLNRARRPQKKSARAATIHHTKAAFLPHKKSFLLILIIALALIVLILILKNSIKNALILPSVESKRLTSYEGVERYPALSPDGYKLAFTWAGEHQDNSDIYIKLIVYNEYHRLTEHPDMEYSATWSFDGNSIAFVCLGEEGCLCCKSILGGEAKKICNLNQSKPHPNIRPFVNWSPNGRWLAFSDFDFVSRKHVIYKLDMSSREITKMTHPEPEHLGDTFPKISPDGKHVAYAHVYSHETQDIYLLNLKTNKVRPLTSDRRQIDDLAWTPDCKKIIFVSNRDGIPRLWSVRAKGGEPQPLEIGGQNAKHLSISRNLRRLVFSIDQLSCNMWRADIRGPDAGLIRCKRLLASSKCDLFPVYSPNGQKIAFCSNQMGVGEICVCNFDGSQFVQLTDLMSSSGCPRWSTNGESILFDSRINGDSDILVVDAGGSKRWRNVTDQPFDDRIPSWSRDGQFIYFGSNRGRDRQIYKMPARGGDAVQVTQGGGNFGYESFDSKFFFYINLGEVETSGPLYQVDLESRQESIAINENIYAFRWVVNPEGIYYIVANENNEPVLKLYRYPERTIEQIGILERWCLFFDVSDDGKYMLLWFSEDYSGDIYMVDFFR
ncbi:serine/threonine-protein kinase [candidate division KSB1 bacterium]|nr:serine/threonine-protein kinase [candidate division KSB1 bacterium]RQW03118.1 MAG: serine/threonine-protein kinase [candidate division KSB1 bacterium]